MRWVARAGDVAVVVDGEHGGRLASIGAGGTELLVTGDGDSHPMLWGCFPMAPWAGRVAGARVDVDGQRIDLPRSLPPHAGHGLVYDRPWTRTDGGQRADVVELRCPLAWPLGGVAEQRIEARPGQVRATLTVRAGDRPMPAEVGWHAWFATAGPLELAATGMYERRGELPTGRLVSPTPPPWDDCFVVDLAHRPVTFRVGDRHVAVGADVDHVVVFDGLDLRGGAGSVAVEPQSGPPDAFHLVPRRLAPGEALTRTMSIRWRSKAPTER